MRYFIILFLALLMSMGGSAVAATNESGNDVITASDAAVSVDVDIGVSDSSTQYVYCNPDYIESTTATTATIFDCISATARDIVGGKSGSEASTQHVLWSLERIDNDFDQAHLLGRSFRYTAGSALGPRL